MKSVYSATAVLEPPDWYAYYGSGMPQLSTVARRVFAIPPTASGGERNCSAFKHIWSDKRSRLLVGRVGLLVYVYFNQRPLKRINKEPNAADWEGFIKYMESQETDEEAAAETLAEAFDKALAAAEAANAAGKEAAATTAAIAASTTEAITVDESSSSESDSEAGSQF